MIVITPIQTAQITIIFKTFFTIKEETRPEFVLSRKKNQFTDFFLLIWNLFEKTGSN